MVIDCYTWLYVVIRYSYTTSCCGLSGIHEAVIQLEAEAQPRLLIEGIHFVHRVSCPMTSYSLSLHFDPT